LVVESPENNPAVNVLVWPTKTEKGEAIAKLEELLHSDEVKKFIEDTWADGSVIPAF
ncbi:MetQ/NlpA family ABC transporter substrate-binding protein, partial [Schaalia hyovaginalis]